MAGTPKMANGNQAGTIHCITPRRMFCRYSYPKRVLKSASNFLCNLQAALAASVPWLSHLPLCVYHIWLLIWALSKPWRCPVWHAILWYKPFIYPIIVQRCFMLDWRNTVLCSHNWKGRFGCKLN